VTHPVRNPEIVWRIEKRREAEVLQALERGEEVGERGTVILVAAGTMHQLNLAGGRIWSLCDGSRTPDEVIDALAAEFAAPRQELAADVKAFLDDLKQRGWLIDG
jgi:pyrroloquinoline quinone biosynthesis protein D